MMDDKDPMEWEVLESKYLYKKVLADCKARI